MRARRFALVLLSLTVAGPALADEGWLYYGGDQGGKHYSSASHIDKNNVDELAKMGRRNRESHNVHCYLWYALLL